MLHIFGDQYELGLDYLQILYTMPQQKLPILLLVSEERNTGKSTILNFLRLNIDEDGWRKTEVKDMERPTLSRSKIKEPCGHISLGFSPEDSGRLTDDYMLRIAEEYMAKMGITNTPNLLEDFITVIYGH